MAGLVVLVKSVPFNRACGFLEDSKGKGTNTSKDAHIIHVYMPLLYEYVYSVEYVYSYTCIFVNVNLCGSVDGFDSSGISSNVMYFYLLDCQFSSFGLAVTWLRTISSCYRPHDLSTKTSLIISLQ